MAQSLYKALVQALREAYRDLSDTAGLKVMLPWLTGHAEEARSLMGSEFRPDGLEANLDVLNTFLRFSHEQGLSTRQLAAAELFAPETFESFKI